MNNSCHKIIFSKRLGTYVAVAETATSQGKSPGVANRAGVAPSSGHFTGLLNAVFAAAALTFFTASVSQAAAPAATALPTGASVSSGSVAVSSNAANMTITQSSDKASVNWNSFNIGSAARVNVQQNSASSVLLNRVVGNDPSQIFGKLSANGQVILINPNGIVFGSGGSVTASAFTASTFGLTDADLQAGKYKYTRNGSTAGVTVEAGASLNATAPGGYVALMGASVDNQGLVSTQGGSVVMASGESVTLPTSLTNNISVPLSGKVRLELLPSTINAMVSNSGTITTEGGQVLMQAAALSDAVASVTHTGAIDTTGAQGGAVTLQADHGIIKATGSITANSSLAGNKGGDIIIGRDADTGVLAKITDVSGATLESQGGFVETSGEHLATDGISIKADTWLLDPNDIVIGNTATTGGSLAAAQTANGISNILASTVNTALAGGTNVIIATSAGTGGNGDISVNSAISNTTAGNTLTLNADRFVIVNANINASNIALNAATGSIYGAGNLTATGGISLSAGVTGTTANASNTLMGTINAASLTKSGLGTVALSGATTLTTLGAGVNVTQGTLINSNMGNLKVPSINITSGATFQANVATNTNYTGVTNVTGAGTFQKTGAGALNPSFGSSSTLNFINNAGGLIDIQAGAIQNDQLVSSHFGSNQAVINIATGAYLDARGEGIQARGLTGGGNLISTWLGSAAGTNMITLGVGSASTDVYNFSGVIGANVGTANLSNSAAYGGGTIISTTPSQTISLVKSGLGTQQLSGANIYTGSTTISGGNLQLGAGGTTGSILAGWNIANSATLSVNRTDTLASPFVLSNAITGTGNFLQAGTGTTKLSGSNTYSGGTTISKGNLLLGNGGSVTPVYNNSVGTGGITLGDANTGTENIGLYLEKGFGPAPQQAALTRAITVTNNGTGTATLGGISTSTSGTGWTAFGGPIVLNKSINIVDSTLDRVGLDGLISGTGGITITTGRVTMDTPTQNTFTGAVQINSGTTLQINSGKGLSAANDVINNGTVRVSGTQNLVINGLSGSGVITSFNGGNAGTATLSMGNANGVGTYAGTIVESGAVPINLIKNGTGTEIFTGANTYSGTTTINTGALQIGNSGTTGTLGTGGAVTVATGANLNFNRSNALTVANNISGAGTVSQNGTGLAGSTSNLTFTGDLSGTTGTFNVNRGTMTLSAITATRRLNAGAVNVNNGSTVRIADGIYAAGTNWNFDANGGGTIDASVGSNFVTGLGTTSPNNTFTTNGGATNRITGAFTGGLNSNAALNTTTFNVAAGTSAVALDVSADITNAGTVVKSGAGLMQLSGTTNLFTGTMAVNAGTLQVGNGGANGYLGTGAISVASGANLNFNRSDVNTVVNAISGGGSLTQSGAGTTTLTGANTYSGTTTISAGTLQVGNGGATGTLGSSAVINNAALIFNRNATADLTVSGVISGTGTLTQAGAGKSILSANNTYAGTTTISAGTLQVGNGGASGTLGSSAVTLAGNANLNFVRAAATTIANDIAGTGNVNATITGTSGDLTISGVINVTGAVTAAADKTITTTAAKSISTTAGTSLTGKTGVALNGNITNTTAGAITVAAGDGTAGSTASITSASGATITQNAAAAVTLTTDGQGDLQVANIVKGAGAGDITVAAGIKVAAGATGGNIKTVAGNTITNSGSGKTLLYTGSALNSGQMSDLVSSLNNLYLTNGAGGTKNAVARTDYGTGGGFAGGPTAQVLFRESVDLTSPSSLAVINTIYGDAVPSAPTLQAAILAANAGTGAVVSKTAAAGTFKALADDVAADLASNATLVATANSFGRLDANAAGYNYTESASSKYAASGATAAKLIVAKKAASVTGSGATVTYNSFAQSVAGYATSGLMTGETVAQIGGVTATGASGTNAGTYTNTVSTGTSTNYDVTTANGSLVIDKAAVTAKANSTVLTYTGGVQSVSGYTLTGLQGLDNASGFTGISASGASGTNVGNYTNVMTVADQTNYTVTGINGSLQIGKANAVLTALSGSTTYNGLTQSITGFSATGLVGADTVASVGASGITSGGSGTNAGTYATTVSGTNANYNFAFVNGSYVINKANLSASLQGTVTKSYDGLRTASNLTNSNFLLTGFATGQGASVSQTNGTYTSKNVSDNLGSTPGSVKTIIDGSQLSANAGTDLNNYILPTQASGNVGVITPAALTIKVNNTAAFVTQDANLALNQGYSYTGLQNGETAAVALVGGAVANSSRTYSGATNPSSGNYTGVYDLAAVPTAVNGNYAITVQKGNLEVVAADKLLVAVNSQSDTYGNRTSINAGKVSAVGDITASYCLDPSVACTGTNLAALTMSKISDTQWKATDNTGHYTVIDTSVAAGAYNTSGYLKAGNYNYTGTENAALSDTGGNYGAGGFYFNGGVLTMAKAAATVTGNSSIVTYNGSSQNVNGFIVTGLASGDTASMFSTLSSGVSGTNAGSYTNTVSGSNADYTLTFVDGTLTIGKANATVTANSATKTYTGVAQSTSGFSATGLVGADTVASLTGVTAGGSGTNAGDYTTTASGTDSNYNLSFNTGNLHINKAAVTVTANSGSTTYNGYNQSLSGYTTSALQNGEVASAVLSVTAGGTGKNAGNYATTASGTADNYDMTFVGGTLTIAKAAATVTADTATKTYNGSSQSVGTFHASGLLGIDTEASLVSVTVAGSRRNVGSVATVASGTDANYNLSFVDGSLGITAANATVTATAKTTTYNAGTQSQASTNSGFIVGDAITISGESSARNAGTYTSAMTVSGADAGNYAVAVTNADLVINKAAATVTAAAQSTTYNAATQTQTGTATTGFLGDAIVVSGEASGRNAGTYTSALAVTGADKDNYVVAITNADLTIAKANATVTAAAKTTTYNAATQSQASTNSGFIVGDAITISGESSARNAGTYTSAMTVSGADAGNYTVAITNADLTIAKAAASVSATAKTTTYNAGTQTQSSTNSGFLGDAIVITGESSARNAGTYTSNLAVTGADKDNYTIAITNADLVIDKASATVSATALTTTYNGATQGQTSTKSGFVTGDAIVVSGEASARNAGTYTSNIAVTGADKDNYTVAITNANLVIDKAAATVTATEQSVVSNGSVQTQSPAAKTGFIVGDAIVVTGEASGTAAGTYKSAMAVTGADAGNYTVAITNADLTITAAPASATRVPDLVVPGRFIPGVKIPFPANFVLAGVEGETDFCEDEAGQGCECAPQPSGVSICKAKSLD